MVKPVYNLPDDAEDVRVLARHWLESIQAHYAPDQVARIAEACDLLNRCRGNQVLETGETQVRHLLSTADILVGLRMDEQTIIAALLNGCLNRAGISEEQISERFGAGVGRMVGDLGRIDQIANVDAVIAAKDQPEHEENLRRLLLGIAEDVRVVLVVLSERLHLMRSIKRLEAERRHKIAHDTRQVYAPLANRLGVWQLKWEMEDLSLRYLEPDDYKRIAKLLGDRRADRERYIADVVATLQRHFADAGIKAQITGRPKHIYSIWRKMQRKNVDFEEIFDLRAVRILVGDLASCYAALGIVHGLWKHIPTEFDDYIATPKGNFYQSLHTAVIGPEDKPLEVQIRTYDMHQHAEFGVAAHWAYKESKGHDAEFQRRIVSMRNWLELKDEAEDGDFIENFKSDLEPAHIYVLTPQAKVIELTKGATPLDFAYAIHSEVGHRCRGAKVNGRIVPLNEPLISGQTVEILTQKNASPSRDWLSPHQGYLKTSKARNRIRQWFKQQGYEGHVTEGRVQLDKELARLGIVDRLQLDHIAGRYNLQKGDDVLAGIGSGELSPIQVAHQIGELRNEERKKKDSDDKIKVVKSQTPPPEKRAEIIVEGVNDLMTHLAHCCKPVPNDAIIGFITRGRGVSVHRQDCPNVLNLPEEEGPRLINVRWGDHSIDAGYQADIQILASDRKGLLRDISSILSDSDVNVLDVNTHSDRTNDTASMRFTVEIKNIKQLNRVLGNLGQMPDVFDVRRLH